MDIEGRIDRDVYPGVLQSVDNGEHLQRVGGLLVLSR
jgi:hypothetical protein